MVALIVRYKVVLFGAIAGAIGGFLYYYWIGCTTGSCAITSQPVPSTLYGAMMGGLLVSMFQRDKHQDKDVIRKDDDEVQSGGGA